MADSDIAAVEASEKFNNNSEEQVKTIFNILSKLKEVESAPKAAATSPAYSEENEDILILRRDPETNETTINKKAYLKLHRSVSPNRHSTIDKIKEQYEQNDKQEQDEVDSNTKQDTLEKLKNKYSPAGLGYSKPLPAPRPRRNKVARSQIILPSSKKHPKNTRFSLNIEKNKYKDVNSNDLRESKTDQSSDEEFITIVTRSDSEESVYKFQKELSNFTMDKKKRVNSFRKIFSVFSNKDKKKKQEERSKAQNKENGETYSENFQNESNNFNRNAPYRHTTGGESKSLKPSNVSKPQNDNSTVKASSQHIDEQLERDYAQMHINQFNRFKQNFEPVSSLHRNNYETDSIPERYPNLDKPYESTYMNMPTVPKYIDTSSSASTLESNPSNFNQNTRESERVELRNNPSNSLKSTKFSDNRRDTPPRLLETQQDVRLVNPKALIPVNSERQFPNPYRNGSKDSLDDSLTGSSPLSQSTPTNQNKNGDSSRWPQFLEIYGTVLDSLENRQREIRDQNKNSLSPKDNDKQSRSPSLEPSKLKLPPNRDILPLSPRVKSPIPSDNISTEKIIATELLKTKRSPTPPKKESKNSSPSHQRLEIDIDYPDNVQYSPHNGLSRSKDNLMDKPPISARPSLRRPSSNSTGLNHFTTSQTSPNPENSVTLRQKISQPSPTERIMTNAQVHMNSPSNRTPTPNNSMQNLSLTPTRPTNLLIRPSTPSGSRIPESPKTTPQKEDIRKSVEAYYWKEIKKLKDQENQELYFLQMHYENMFPYGYAEDPITVRRSRSTSPSSARNGRRSLSLPRDPKPSQNVVSDKYYLSNAIPENRAVTNTMQPRSVQQIQFQQQQYFKRNTPERRTIDGSNSRNFDNSTNSLYRPIFKRGSLNTPPAQSSDDSLKRKVSFSGAQDLQVQAWPTKNGFTQSPPQRRIDKTPSQGDDDVFLPNRYSEITSRYDPSNEELYYNTRQNVIRQNAESLYAPGSNQNLVFRQQRAVPENTYVQRITLGPRYLPSQPEEVLYGQPIDALPPAAMPRLTRHGSIQMNEELYPQRPRRVSYQNNSLMRTSVASSVVPNKDMQYVSRQSINQQTVQPLRREIIINDEIFGQFGNYVGPNASVRVVQNQNVYSSRQSVADYNSRVRDEIYNRPPPRQVSVSNKVCDIYGQIHDADPPKVRQSGMIMGQLQRNPGSPVVVRTSHSQLPGRDNFVRNSRLTASANDMHRRVQNPTMQYSKDSIQGRIGSTQVINDSSAPTRPLPPVPQGKKGASRDPVRQTVVSDTENVPSSSDMKKVSKSNSKNKKRGIFGK